MYISYISQAHDIVTNIPLPARIIQFSICRKREGSWSNWRQRTGFHYIDSRHVRINGSISYWLYHLSKDAGEVRFQLRHLKGSDITNLHLWIIITLITRSLTLTDSVGLQSQLGAKFCLIFENIWLLHSRLLVSIGKYTRRGLDYEQIDGSECETEMAKLMVRRSACRA